MIFTASGDFPARLGAGRTGIAERASPPSSAPALGPQVRLRGLGAARCSRAPRAPGRPQPPGSAAKDSGVTTPRLVPRTGHLQGGSPLSALSPIRPHLLGVRESRWAPERWRAGLAGAGPAGRTGSGAAAGLPPPHPEPGDPAIDSNREAAVYSNTAPPGPSPGDAARPAGCAAVQAGPPSLLAPLPGASACLAPPPPPLPPPPDITLPARGLSAARARRCANLHS